MLTQVNLENSLSLQYSDETRILNTAEDFIVDHDKINFQSRQEVSFFTVVAVGESLEAKQSSKLEYKLGRRFVYILQFPFDAAGVAVLSTNHPTTHRISAHARTVQSS